MWSEEFSMMDLLAGGFGNMGLARAQPKPSLEDSLILRREKHVSAIIEVSKMERILDLSVLSSAYYREEKYDEAFGLLDSLYQLGPEVNFARVLLKSYISALNTKRIEDATKARDELVDIIREKFDVDAEDVKVFAQKALINHNFLKAFLFFQVAFKLLKSGDDSKPTALKVHVIQGCISGSSVALKQMVKNFVTSESIAKKHLFPQVKEMTEFSDEILNDGSKGSCLIQAQCLTDVFECEVELSNHDTAQASMKEMIKKLKDVFKEEVTQSKTFRECLLKLGCSYFGVGKYEEALSTLSEYEKVYEKARLYVTREDSVGLTKAKQLLYIARLNV